MSNNRLMGFQMASSREEDPKGAVLPDIIKIKTPDCNKMFNKMEKN